MSIIMTCKCGQKFRAGDDQAGQMVRCPACNERQRVPETEETIQAVDPAEPRRRRFSDEDVEPRQAPATDRRMSGKAITSLLLGVVSLCLPVLPSLLGILFAILSIRDINRSGGRVTGKGLAIGGLIVSVIGLIICTPAGILATVGGWNAMEEKRSRDRSSNNLRQIGLAMHNYHDSMQQFPPAVVCDAEGKPLYSWRVLLLPYLEQNNLYQQFHLDEPWDSPHNLTLLPLMPKVYAPTKNVKTPEPYSTFYQVFDGPVTEMPGPIWRSGRNETRPLPPGQVKYDMPQPGMMPGGKRVFGLGRRPPSMFAIPDGTSNTFMVVEAGDAVPWTKPADILYSANQPFPKLGGLHNGDFWACYADGSVRWISKSTPQSSLRLYITCDDGMPVPY